MAEDTGAGWARPAASTEWHYFEGLWAACGWLYVGLHVWPVPPGEDACAECLAKVGAAA